MDNRKALLAGDELIFNLKKKYIIIEETGRGAGCLVYTASCQDSAGLTHIVRIKECFPYNLEIKRAADNSLQVSEEFCEQFLKEKKKFCDAYKRNVQLKNTLGIMNSTIDAIEIYEQNHTWYCVTGMIEGADYRHQSDSCLQDIFVRMETLCEIVRKYHDNGFLHLDIKPENILILPETREHIVLFDFDSVILKADLHKGNTTRLSCSDGFSAPELAGGRRDKIDKWTDIYSVGAVVYYKIFDKAPKDTGYSLGTNFDFSKMKFADKRYQPELYKKLNTFLQKTLATSGLCRYRTMEDVISDLRELQKLSDTEAVFLHSSFSYHSAYFAGRQRELLEIGRALLENHVVFLSGMGGIGKTETAKKYVYEHREDFGKVVFAGFYHSVLETVCGLDFEINGIKRQENESEEKFFERKLEILKSTLTNNDLIILDNFDVETDEHLEELLDCPCRFLITTREDFRDYNYRQITIDKMEDICDLTDLVKMYNEEEYTEEETACIERLIEFVEYHTMTVELLAKYLRITGEAPSVLLERMTGIEGITNIKETGIRQRKDKKLRSESVVKHLRILFDLSGFSPGEEELIMSLSLLGAVRIRREVFLEYCDIYCKINNLDNLIRRGWIEFDEPTGKISLHQIILDLIYNDKKPNEKNCPHITEAMTDYAGRRCAGRTEKEVKRRLLNEFAQRINGNGLRLADFLTAYCGQVCRRKEYIERAEKISRTYIEKAEEIGGKYTGQAEKTARTYSEKKAYRLMYKICSIKITIEAEYSGMLLSELEETEYLDKKSEYILSLAQDAYAYIQAGCCTKEDLGRACVELAFKLDYAAGSADMYYIDEKESVALNRLLDYASYLLEEAERYLAQADMPCEEKQKLFEKIQSFYSGEDYFAMYRSEKYEDSERVWHYQEILDKLRMETKDSKTLYLHSGDITFFETVEKAKLEGEYLKAETFYKKELDKGETPYETVWRALADLYQKMGRTDEAVKCLETVLQTDKEQIESEEDYWRYTSYISAELSRLLLMQGKHMEAEKYLKELIFYNREQKKTEWVLFGNYYLYKIEETKTNKEKLWRLCLGDYKKILKDGEISEYLTDFVIEYLSGIEDKDKQMQSAVLAVESLHTYSYSKEKGELIKYILDKCENVHKGYILMLIRYAQNLKEACEEKKTEEALAACEKAEKLYEENYKTDKYLYSLIHKNIGACCLDIGDYDRGCEEMKKCNYYLLAQIQAEKADNKQAALWEEAAEEYSFLENWEMAEQCYKERFSLPDSLSGWYRSGCFDDCWGSGVKRLKGLFLQKRRGEALLWEEKLLEELFCSIFESENNEKPEYRAQQSAWKLKETADILADGGCGREAFYIYILSVIARLNLYPPREIFFDFLKKDGRKEWLKREFKKALHCPVTGKMTDFAADIWDILQKADIWKDIRTEYEADMAWFLKTYKHQDIEFKR